MKTARRNAARFIVTADLPFRVASNPFLWRIAEPFTKLPVAASPKLIRRLIVEDAAAARRRVKDALDGERVAITTDAWTSPARVGFLSLTCAWISKDWKFTRLYLACRGFESPHNAKRVSDLVRGSARAVGVQGPHVAAAVRDAGRRWHQQAQRYCRCHRQRSQDAKGDQDSHGAALAGVLQPPH